MEEIKSNIFAVQCTKMGLVLELASVKFEMVQQRGVARRAAA